MSEPAPDGGPRNAWATFGLAGPDWANPESGIVGVVDPDAVTALLGITPTRAHRLGEPGRRPLGGGPAPGRPNGFWGLSTHGQVESDHLQDHLEWLLDRLDPVRESIRRYVREANVASYFSCHVYCNDACSVTLTTTLLTRLAAMGAECWISVDCILEEEE